MLSRVLAFDFLWSLATTVSEQGWILDEFSLEVRQHNYQQVCFCGEGLLDLNFLDCGGPGRSVGEISGPSEEGKESAKSPGMGEGSPGAGL